MTSKQHEATNEQDLPLQKYHTGHIRNEPQVKFNQGISERQNDIRTRWRALVSIHFSNEHIKTSQDKK